MSRQQKLKAAATKEEHKDWLSKSGQRLVERLKAGKLKDVNPAYQRMVAEEFQASLPVREVPARRKPGGVPVPVAHRRAGAPVPEVGGGAAEESIDPETGLPCVNAEVGLGPEDRGSSSSGPREVAPGVTIEDVPEEEGEVEDKSEVQNIISEDAYLSQFNTPFGPGEKDVRLTNPLEESVGGGSINVEEALMMEPDPYKRDELRRKVNEEEGVPDFYDPTYVDVYAAGRYRMKEPSAFLRQDFESRLADLLGASARPPPDEDEHEEGISPAERLRRKRRRELRQKQKDRHEDEGEPVDVSSVERQPRERLTAGFVSPMDAPCFLHVHESVVRHMLLNEPWFRTYHQWAVPLWNSHTMLPQESISFGCFISQNKAAGGFLHSETYFEDTNQVRMIIKFNNYSQAVQDDLLQTLANEEPYQTQNSISGYVSDFFCCEYILDLVPGGGAFRIFSLKFGFM